MEEAVEILCRMRGLGKSAAAAFARRCTPDEQQAIAACETGDELQAVLDAVADRMADRGRADLADAEQTE
jgi:hypothetical protein